MQRKFHALVEQINQRRQSPEDALNTTHEENDLLTKSRSHICG